MIGRKYYRKVRRDGVPALVSIYAFVWFFVIIIMSLVMMGCKSVRYVTVPEYHHDSIYLTKVQWDSIYMHDSIYVKEWMRGDTVFVSKTQWKTKYVERLRTDTAYIEKTDSVAVPYPVERKATVWEQVRLDYGGWAIGILFILVIIVVIRFSRKLLPRW